MSDRPSFLERIGRWFRGLRGYEPLPLERTVIHGEATEDAEHGDNGQIQRVKTWRITSLLPWRKRSAQIAGLQQSFAALTDLLTSIRQNLERQNERHDELLRYLTHLPEVVKEFPENQRLQSETLTAISQQIQEQNYQQGRVTDIMEKVSDAQRAQKESLRSLEDRMETLNEYDQRIVDNMKYVSSAMQSVSRNSESSTQVLQQLHDSLTAHDKEMEQILKSQAMRFTIMLGAALVLAVGAMTTVMIVGYKLLHMAR